MAGIVAVGWSSAITGKVSWPCANGVSVNFFHRLTIRTGKLLTFPSYGSYDGADFTQSLKKVPRMAIGQQQSARLARYNRAVVLDLIRRLGPTSKSELAERSGLAVSSVLNILASLSRRGLIREVGLGPSTGGRPPTLIELDPDAHFAIGVNIRPTFVEAVLIDLVGDIRSETMLPCQGGYDPESVAGTVVEAVGQVIRFGRVHLARVLGVAVGCPGPVTAGRTVVGTPGFPGWEGVQLADRLEQLLGLPVILENDANLGALGEYRHGAWSKQGNRGSLIYLYADHGVGAGIVIDGSVQRGVDELRAKSATR